MTDSQAADPEWPLWRPRRTAIYRHARLTRLTHWLRVERQLGYKHAKYVMRIEVTDGLDGIWRGKGGFWPDRGCEW